MNKGEPSLVPEWLRSSGHSSSNHLLISSSSSSSHSDASSSPNNNSRNKNSRSKSDVDPFLDRSSSTNSRNGSSSSAKHPYSSFNFNRSHHRRDRVVDPWDLLDTSQDQLRRSHSMVTRKQADHLSRGLGLKTSYNGNGNSFLRTTGFDKDFPSLGDQDVVRVSSPCGLGSAVQSLPVGNSALIGGEGWTSALAEVPNVVVVDKASPKAASTGGGLNMAEALVQAPARTLTPPQGSVKTQRLEDLAIKQSRQLIPVVPSAPKSSILNSSDKSKTKRAGEACLAPSRNSPSVLLGNVQSNPVKSEKKLLVLKPATRETGVKESASPSSSNNPNSSSQQQLINTAQSATTVRSTNSPREQQQHKGIASGQTIEKKPSLAQTQSRHAFFSTLKKANISTHPVNTSSVEEKVNKASDPSSSLVLEVTQRNNTIGFEAADTPDEEEAEFLRSLGWDENNGEVEALTEEEIKAFNERYNKLRPQKLSIIQEQSEGVA